MIKFSKTMNIKSFFNLKRVLFILIFLAFTPSFAFLLIYHYYTTKHFVEYQKIVQLNKLEKYVCTENFIMSITSTLESMAHFFDIKQPNKKEMELLFKNIVEKKSELYNLILLDKNGDVIVSAKPIKGKINASDRLYFKRAMATKKLSTGEFAISRTTGKPTIHFAMPILNDSKEVTSVILAVPNWQAILPNFSHMEDEIYILDENGKIVVSKNNYLVGKVFQFYDPINNHTESSGSFITNNNFLFFVRATFEGKPLFTVVSKAPYDKYLSSINRMFYEWVLIIVLLFITTYLIIRKFAEKYIYSPLKEIEKTFNDFDLNRDGEEVKKELYGEFNSLINSFNKLSRLVKEQTNEIISEKTFWLTTFNKSPDIIYIVNKEYKIIKANEQFFSTFHISPENLENFHCYDIVHKTTTIADYCHHKKVLNELKSMTHEAFSPELKKWFYITIAPLIDNTNNLMGTLHILKDITPLKKSQEEKLHIERKLLQTQKLESLGILAGGVAHDFNNFLMGILGNAELALMKRDELPSDVIKNLETIKKITEKAANLTQQMLAYSGKGKFLLKEIELNSFLKDIFDLIKVSIPKKAVIHLNLDTSKQLFIKGDPGQIEQVIMNLIINAGEALDSKEGLITISTGRQWCDKKYFSETIDAISNDLSEGDYVFFEVTDTGIGMDKETMAKIFEPFFTTKFTGRGLGLSAIQGIVRGHNGAIRVYSEKGKGTSFKIIFPAVQKTENIAHEMKEMEKILNINGCVMVVDDEYMVREATNKMLELMGLKTILGKDGKEALSIFKERHDDIAIVLLDLTMPGLNGDEVFRELKKIKPDVKVILMSGYNDQETSQRLVGRGITAFIQKPFSYEKLKEKIENILKDN